MNTSCLTPKRSSGFSLIEMMLAMLIGLVIMGGVMKLYTSTRDTQRSSEDQLALLGDARFAIETIAYDLRHTGLWGRQNLTSVVACQKSGAKTYACPAVLPAATSDCASEEYINLERALFAADNSNPYSATCANQSYKAGTDVLSLRYADTNKLDDTVLSASQAYIRTTTNVGMLFLGPNFPASPYKELADVADPTKRKYSNHLLVSRVYYVSDYTDAPGDGLPSLRRVDLQAGPLMQSEVMLPGVEDFQLEFGVDIGANGVKDAKLTDGQVDSYVSADGVANWDGGEVVAVRVWLLMRSDRKDRDGIGGAQTFTIAGAPPVTFNDGYRRYLVSSVVKLRNAFQIDLQKAGS
ncbi:MAG: PilW family protein [Gammaproteobacteria bacterium]|nr:PilW family protein [Gammaproteobacteria bacterium]